MRRPSSRAARSMACSIGTPSERDAIGGLREQPAGELVVARRKAHAPLFRRALVHLGRSARAGAAAGALALVVHLEQTVGGETIEVVSGDGALQTDGVGGLLAAHPGAPAGDVVVQRPAAGLGERADGVEIGAVLVIGFGGHG